MSDYDYGNARLHAMKSRLITRLEFEAMLNAGNLSGLITEIGKTAYQKAIESALARVSGIAAIEAAIRSELENTVGKLRTFYLEDALDGVDIALRGYDIHNLKTILRSLSNHIPASEVAQSLFPIGELKFNLLQELSMLHSPREAIDALASMGHRMALPLMALRTEHPGAKEFEFELALDRWHYLDCHRHMLTENTLGEGLDNAMALQADLTNAITVLRFAKDPAELDVLKRLLDEKQVEYLFIGPGRISLKILAEACTAGSVALAIEKLANTALGPSLQAGLKQYEQTQRLSDIEKQLMSYRLRWMINQMTKDSLGIGFVLGYTAMKTNEVGNIRWIARGIDLGLSPNAIREELEIT